jgi:hypothetical protein
VANAKRCDICNRYYDVPDRPDEMIYSEQMNTSMIRVLRLNPEHPMVKHDVMQFDACNNCLQDVLDYMLGKRADSEKETE